MEALSYILEHKIVAIVRGAQPSDVPAIAHALYEGGIRLLEITMNSADALPLIGELSDRFDGRMLIGAGTVLDAETAERAIGVGAKFILSPTVSAETIAATKQREVVSIPGAFTPTEVLSAYLNGADIVKVFPARMGAGYIRDIRGPLPHIPLLPTGGVNLENIRSFQQAGAVGFGIGSSLVDTEQGITEAGLTALTEKAKQYVRAIA